MIPVQRQPEPKDFDKEVRQKGLKWLASHNVDPGVPLPKGKTIQPHWQGEWNERLWNTYNGVCAYLAIYLEYVAGPVTTDHFIPKSRWPGGAYEWGNYRLSCLACNRNKSDSDGVLDPFELRPETFFLNLSNGKIYPNPHLEEDYKKKAQRTIERLKLDSPNRRRMRTDHFNIYTENSDSKTLAKLSPFVWYEAKRQGL